MIFGDLPGCRLPNKGIESVFEVGALVLQYPYSQG